MKPKAKVAVKSEPKISKSKKVMKLQKVKSENKKDKLYTNEEIIKEAAKKVANEESQNK